MNENQKEVAPKLAPQQSSMKRRIEVIFEFTMPKPKPTFYRAVRAADGGFRMEKRGQDAKTFRTFMWCGSEEGLFKHKEAVEFYYRNWRRKHGIR